MKHRVGPRLLLVDDDDLVRATIERSLSEVSFDVTSVGSADEALVLVEKGDGFDCVLTDLTMPTIRGTELIAAIREIRPGQPCVLLTGAGTTSARSELAEWDLADVAVLTKPFSANELVGVVRSQTGHRVDPDRRGSDSGQMGNAVV